jgi:hypothetical protein
MVMRQIHYVCRSGTCGSAHEVPCATFKTNLLAWAESTPESYSLLGIDQLLRHVSAKIPRNLCSITLQIYGSKVVAHMNCALSVVLTV